jgi:ergothioneine biosynthesis protein EgtB
VLAAYRRVRAATEARVRGLEPEDMVAQSMDDCSPAKWHLAHTTWFFETFVLRAEPGHAPFHPAFEVLFNSYYEAVGPQFPRPRRGLLTRPTVREVLAYRAHVDAAVERRLAAGVAPEIAARVELGLHHEQQHQELILMDLKHLFAQSPLRPALRPDAAPPSVRPAPPLAWHAGPDGLVELGHAGAGFCFDNEAPRHRVFLGPYALASRCVTNGEYAEFIADDGYRRPDLWLSDGWATARRLGWTAPLYWHLADGTGSEFTLGGTRPLDPHAPVVHVSHYEADAYARWAGARLPTEAEWETVAAGAAIAGNFVESGRLHPTSAPDGPGPQQLFGDVWEWTASAYLPYPGYRPAAGALGEYNGKFMSGQMVLRGGSCVTPAEHARASYRNFFPPAARWPFAGIRLIRDA